MRLIERERESKLTFAKFRIGDLFDKVELKFRGSYPFKKIKDNVSKIPTTEFNLPLANAKTGDNGIMFWGRESDFENANNTIEIVANGAVATGDVYPQPHKMGVVWDAFLIKPKATDKREILLFLSGSLKKSIKYKYSYENKSTWNKIRNDFIDLPTKNGAPDYNFMEVYIKAQQKLAIKNMMDWRERQIMLTKSIVAK